MGHNGILRAAATSPAAADVRREGSRGVTTSAQRPASYFPAIEKKYGRPISDWQTLIRSSGLTKHMELVSYLKSEHGLGHGHANALVAYTLPQDGGTASTE